MQYGPKWHISPANACFQSLYYGMFQTFLTHAHNVAHGNEDKLEKENKKAWSNTLAFNLLIENKI